MCLELENSEVRAFSVGGKKVEGLGGGGNSAPDLLRPA